jgi:hypothetical protein
MAGRTAAHGPSWTLFNTAITLLLGALVALVGIIYFNIRDDMKGLRDDVKDLRNVEQQMSRDLADVRVGVAKIGGQIDQILQRLPPSTPR